MPHTVHSRPLLVRPGARFRCVGDGLCCSDIHALGPLTRREAREMKALDAGSVEHNDDAEGLCMATSEHGQCKFMQGGLCSVHATLGPEKKPMSCRRFPYGLICTPDGGRVTTEHRCSCRTLGHRPELDLNDAEPSLRDQAGRLVIDQELPARIPLTSTHRVIWKFYTELERALLVRLADGERAEDVLDSHPLSKLSERTWAVHAAEHFCLVDASNGGVALGYFGDALLHLATGHFPPQRPRPWAAHFDRAMARCGATIADPERMYNDWISDEIWMFRWLPWGAFDRGRSEMATRLCIARTLQQWFEAKGLRADQATAEAIMIVDIATASTEWPHAVADIQF